jgi:endonuclease/exonuclease/phosphatase family metal-dependent hydrolase
MVALVTADEPDVVCLQEVPVWALPRLGRWCGMRAFPAIARSGLRPAGVAGWITRLDNGLFRSAVAGQANAVLVRPDHEAADLGSETVSAGRRERRVCQAVRLEEVIVVANTHLSSDGDDQAAELERARRFAESHARPGDAVVLAGDFNRCDVRLDGYSSPGPGIDHVLVRAAATASMLIWPEQRRLHNGVVLSDHAPVEVLVG